MPPKKLRVMRVITRMNVGGPALQAALLCERLAPERFESRLISGIEGEREGNMLQLRLDSPVRPVILPTLGREISLKADFVTLRELVRLMRRYRPHVVHTHLSKAGFFGRVAARYTRRPAVVHTYHGHIFAGYDEFSRPKMELFRRMDQLAARCTDRILTLTAGQGAELQAAGIGRASQYRVVPLGLELEPFLEPGDNRAALRQELGLPAECVLIGHISRLVPVKTVNYFIEAAQKVRLHHPEAVFLVIGDGPSRPALEDETRKRGLLDSGVRFLGFRADLPYLVGGLDIVALTSIQEGTPVAIIEALTAGKPVLATDVGGVGTIVRHKQTGWLSPARDVENIAQGLSYLLEHPQEAAQWGQAGHEVVYPQNDSSRLLRDIEELYLEILQEKGVRLAA
jgi:glycosyltransferase involved in cell wall biosynthesis